MPSTNTRYALSRAITAIILLSGLTLTALIPPPSRLPANTFSSSRLSSKARATNPLQRANVTELSRRLPLSFEANRGQADGQVKFLSRGAGYCLLLAPAGATLHLVESGSRNAAFAEPSISRANGTLDCGFKDRQTGSMLAAKTERGVIESSIASRSTSVQLKLVGGRSPLSITGVNELPSKSNYLTGSDARTWATNISNYSKVKYEGVYRGIDMVYYGHPGNLEYDFVVAPGARTESIRMAFEGVNNDREIAA